MMLLALAAAGAATAPARPPAGTAMVGCARQSSASFPHAFSDPHNLRLGPLVFVDAHNGRTDTAEQIARTHGRKSPALLRPGHSAVVSIDRANRSFARLEYSSADRTHFGRLPHTIRFVACRRSRAESEVDGARVTFWPGFFVLRRAPACVRLTVTIDGHPALHRTLAFARPSCPAT